MSNAPSNPKTTCLKCGNNPTNHLAARIDSLVFWLLDPLVQSFFKTPLARPVVFMIDMAFQAILLLTKPLGLMYFIPADEVLKSDRGEVMRIEALRRGYQFEVLKVTKRLQDTYRVTFSNGKKLIFAGVPRLDRVNAVAAGWMDDKWKMKQCLSKAGVMVSRGENVYSWLAAKEVFNKLEKPVIVKPRYGSRGRHTTTHIYTIEDLKTAYWSARELSWPVIVEEHLVGSVYRATCVGGELVGVLAGDPPRITGDGIHTIEQLIQLKNTNRPKRVGEVKITTKLTDFLARLNYTLDTVLLPDQRIDVSEKIGLSYGGSSREDTAVTHPKLKLLLAEASKAVGDPLLGFDFITPDITADPATVKWGIIECNSVPFINLHHDPLEGEPINAAGALFDYLEAELARG